ncbi:MAG TPA: hypothetical protein DGT58_06330, partial [Erysipelotrichaceae bacterium]|nr:hypothetical protein [Erysipelotrichaceae bacterium]
LPQKQTHYSISNTWILQAAAIKPHRNAENYTKSPKYPDAAQSIWILSRLCHLLNKKISENAFTSTFPEILYFYKKNHQMMGF